MIRKLLLNALNTFIESENIEEYNLNKKCKILIASDMLADMQVIRYFDPIVTELFIRGRKLNISLVFNTQWHFSVTENIRLNSATYFIMKMSNKESFNHI